MLLPTNSFLFFFFWKRVFVDVNKLRILRWRGYPGLSKYMHACISAQSLSRVRLFATPWTVVCQAPLLMGFSRQEYWSGLPFSPPEDLLNPGIEPATPVSPALAGRFFTTEPPEKPIYCHMCFYKREMGILWDIEEKDTDERAEAMWPQRQIPEWCGLNQGRPVAMRSWTRQGADFPLEPMEGRQTSWNLDIGPVRLILNLWSLELGENTFLWFGKLNGRFPQTLQDLVPPSCPVWPPSI